MNFPFRCLLLLVASLASGVSAAAESEAQRTAREHAVELARLGNVGDALSKLAALRKADPSNVLVLHDQAVVLGWAGRDREALQNAELFDLQEAPDHVVSAIAKSARNTAEFEESAHWYTTLLDRDAANLDARRGLSMTYADAGEFRRAWTVIEQAPENQRNDVAITLTEAYIYEREGRSLEALAAYQRASDTEPENRDALRGEALMLRALLLPQHALALARKYPNILNREEVLNLEADVAAVQLRYGSQTFSPAPRRHQGTDLALAKLDALLTRQDLEHDIRLRLRFDRIVALTNRLLMTEAIDEFESLNVNIELIPPYALIAAGRAYLSEKKPEMARELLELAIQRQPENFHIKFELFFAYVDLRQAKRAASLAEELMATLPEVNRIPGSRVVKGNRHYLRAAIMFGLSRAYFEQLGESQEHFEDLLTRVPHNTDIRHELANVYRWRGWLDRSLSEYAQVLAVEPELLAARVGNAHTRLDSRDYASVEREVLTLGNTYGDEPMVKRLAERWQTHNSQELVTRIALGDSSGTTFGNEQFTVDVAWYSRPLARRYRVIAFAHDNYADFEEGDEHVRRIGSGLDFRHKQWVASARLSAPRDGGQLGFRGAADYRLSDAWNFGAVIETESDATPLRGQRVGVSSDLVGVSATLRKHESADVRAQLAYRNFSDGNTGLSLLLLGQQRLFSGPRYRLTLNGEAGFDSHKLDNVAYFSPRHSTTWSLGLQYEWYMARRYDFGLTHTISAATGQYAQSGYQADNIWALGYRFMADLSDRLSAEVGFSRRSNVYDGGREYSRFVSGGLRWKF